MPDDFTLAGEITSTSGILADGVFADLEAEAGAQPKAGAKRLLRSGSLVTGGLIVLVLAAVAVFAPLLAPYGYATPGTSALTAPSWTHVFGTDDLGRDMLSRVIYGTRESLGIVVPVVLISLVVGLILAIVSAYYGGWFDSILMRVVDVIFSFTAVLLAIALVAVLGPSLKDLIIVLAILFTPRFAVVLRAGAQGIRRREYVEAAESMGASPFWVSARHIIPNILPIIFVETALSMSSAVLTDAALSFLGLGAPPPAPTWGGMLAEAQPTMTIAPWTIIYPGLTIVLLVIALNLVADGLQDRFNLRKGIR
jgi:peptide/nickel transport system ATP-binding protein